jgi:glyoxylase-like metal-dependent hydrolase (beta-lactamase superfamily II)
MLIKSFVFGSIETNCYLVACEKTLQALVVDPNIRTKQEKEQFVNVISHRNLQLKYIVNTHHHIDHTSGNAMLKEAFDSQILIHELDAKVLPEQWQWLYKTHNIVGSPPCPSCENPKLSLDIIAEQKKAITYCDKCGWKYEIFPSPPADRLLHHGDVIQVGETVLHVIHTPGHSPGGICLYSVKEHILFSGDTLFNLSKGRTDAIDGSEQDMMKSLNELMKLPEDTKAYPGHGEPTTIGREKRENPYLLDKK